MRDIETRLQRMERILTISRDLASTVTLEHLLQKIVNAAVELTDSEAAAILLPSGNLHFIVATSFTEQLAEIPVPVDTSVAGAAFSTGEPVIVPDIRSDPRYYPVVEQLIGFEARSLLAVPLLFKGRPIGVLEVENKQGCEEFDQEDVETLTSLAAQAAVAIETARLVESLQKARDLAQALIQTGIALSSTLDYEEVLDRILEQMSRVVPYDAANIALIEGKVARVFRGRGYEKFGTSADLTETVLNVAEASILHKMQQSGQPLVISDVRQNDTWVYSRLEHTWIQSYVGAPIRIRDQVIGFLNVNSATVGFFSQVDAERLQVFSNHVAIAIRNAQLYRLAQQELVERVRVEEELREHRDHLEELVQERTDELEAQNEELDAFAHTVAHDLKSPLTSVIGYSELLEEHYATLPLEQVREFLHAVAEKGRKMTNIVEELLLLASVRKEQVQTTPLDMTRIVAKAQRCLADMIEEYQAEIILPATWPAAWDYISWVEEVWINYLSNGLKYGGRPPRLELGATVQPDGLVRFWVRDNGHGIEPKDQARLFTPFTRLQVRAKGHGLGLSIVQRIIERLDGQVGLESEIGAGSTFWFTLPALH